MTQSNRIDGGSVERGQPISFKFNNKVLTGYTGDTLASALIANGQRLVARSFKFHRPRGIFSAGSEEPSALVQLREGAHQEPNTRATVIELFDGLTATSQNHRGSLEHDFLAINDLFAPFLSAGFYYKTFMWPKALWEKLYEPFIRSAAGLGRLSFKADEDVYDKGFLHCDLLVIGAGPAGLAAALAAGGAGAEVIIADEDFLLGGRLNADSYQIQGKAASAWAADVVAKLNALANVRVMPRTTVYGAFDHGIYGALERKTDHLYSSDGKPRQISWKVYSKHAMLCAGATEQHIGFGNNDRPGIMLAGAVRAYVNRWGAVPGKRVALFTNNDDGWQTAIDLAAKGIEISAIVDSRDIAPVADILNAQILMGGYIADTSGRKGLTSVKLSNGQTVPADCLAVSGGWNPNIHLTCHQRGRPSWSEDLSTFIPGKQLPVGMRVAGAANGTMSLGKILSEGWDTASAIVRELGLEEMDQGAPLADNEAMSGEAYWYVKECKHRAWVDLQNDVTVKDIKQAHLEGFRSVELLKRYTTLGMATDQGKTANVTALAIMAECTNQTIPETGTTMFRPPYTPVPIGAFAGRARGKEFRPVRYTPTHKWAEEQGASFVESGAWMRAQWFPLEGEKSWRESVDREVTQVRSSVGICDVTTLGKIDVQGRNAAEFLNKIYCNGFAKLPISKVRYGLMLREDGFAMDDGTTARLSENHFAMTTTTANAVSVFRHMEFCHQCLWPDLDVHLISTTEQWAQFAVAGPNSRNLLSKVVDDDFDLSNDAFPFMACTELSICGGTPARLFRISFSGELAYEVAVAARYGDALMRALMVAGEEFGVVPYGIEALGVMRIEKGHAAGPELNGQTTAQDLGMGRMVSKAKDSIGSALSEREALNSENGLALMGLRPINVSDTLASGAHFLEPGAAATMENDQGWMTSTAFSPSLGHSIGLGFIRRGQSRIGEVLRAYDPVRNSDLKVEIVSPHFIDPEGERLRG